MLQVLLRIQVHEVIGLAGFMQSSIGMSYCKWSLTGGGHGLGTRVVYGGVHTILLLATDMYRKCSHAAALLVIKLINEAEALMLAGFHRVFMSFYTIAGLSCTIEPSHSDLALTHINTPGCLGVQCGK